MKEKKIDFLLEMYNDQWTQARQSEDQRSTFANLILTIAAATIALLSVDSTIKISKCSFSLLLIMLGIFGILISAKLYERYSLHTIRARVYRKLADSLINDTADPIRKYVNKILEENKNEINKYIRKIEENLDKNKDKISNYIRTIEEIKKTQENSETQLEKLRNSRKSKKIIKLIKPRKLKGLIKIIKLLELNDRQILEKPIEDFKEIAEICKEYELTLIPRLPKSRLNWLFTNLRLNWIWYILYIIMIIVGISFIVEINPVCNFNKSFFHNWKETVVNIIHQFQ